MHSFSDMYPCHGQSRMKVTYDWCWGGGGESSLATLLMMNSRPTPPSLTTPSRLRVANEGGVSNISNIRVNRTGKRPKGRFSKCTGRGSTAAWGGIWTCCFRFYVFFSPWSESASELYRPSDLRMSAKRLPTCADRRCHVVSVTDPSGRILSVF
jgi:hypothetical protein